MKKSFVILTLLITALASFAQSNEFRIIASSDFFEPVQYDFLPEAQQFSLGLEYSRAIGKRFDLETGLMYSKSGFQAILCDFCDVHFWPYYEQTRELNAKLGVKWKFIEREKVGLYTAIGFQANRKISPTYDFGIPEEDHLSGAIYQDIGIRFKLNKSFSLDFELKGRYNLPDDSSIYYYKDDIKVGAGIGFNYAF